MNESLWSRLKKARLFRIVAVYLGASWGVLQVTMTLRDALGLPDWLPPVAVILLAVGLLVILATAWVQAHPLTAGREAADEVPTGWELGLDELRDEVVRGRVPHLTWARALVGGVFLFSLLFGVAGLYVVIQDRGRSFTPEPLVAAEAAPGIAVMPFSTSGAELEEWQEGLVTLMSTGLDGAGGLRAIDSRTVLAQWDRRVGPDRRADLETTLDVARSAGARYALVGSAVGIGEETRLVADVYRVADGRVLGQALVEGSTGAPHRLVDRLSIEVLEVLSEEGQTELAEVDLAAVTTTSIPALKAFLEGEARFRRSDFGDAIEAYRRAVQEDSTFAFAYYRLYSAYGWWKAGNPLVETYRAAAMRHADRLPQRERRLVRADQKVTVRDPAGLDSLRSAVESYPDDAEAWYLLGEAYFHDGVLVPPDETERAFRRAADLDPTFAPYRIHLVDLAFRYHADSALARRRVADYREVAGEGGKFLREWEAALRVLAGAPGYRTGDADSLRALGEERLARLLGSLEHPRLLVDGALVVLRALRGTDPPPDAGTAGPRGDMVTRNLFHAGKIDEALGWLDELRRRSSASGWVCQLVGVVTDGYPVPPERLEEVLAVPAASPSSPLPACQAFIAAEVGDREAFERGRDGVAAFEASLEAAGDTSFAREMRDAREVATAYWAWRQEGEPGPLLEALGSRVYVLPFSPVWLGRALRDAGRTQDARYAFEMAMTDPMAHLELARLHEAEGRNGEARRAYRDVLAAWKEAGPAMEPWVAQTRRGLERLEGEG